MRRSARPEGWDVAHPANRPAARAEQERRLSRDRLQQAIRCAVDGLPPTTGLMLRLHFEEGWHLAEVSRALGVSQWVLYRTMRQVLAVLRRRLREADVTWDDVHDLLDGGMTFDLGWESRLENEMERFEPSVSARKQMADLPPETPG